MNYKIGDKFIFEIDRIYSSKKHSESRYGIKGFENFVLSKRKLNELQTHKNIKELNEYDAEGWKLTEERIKNIRGEAYQKGLEAAWEAARKYCCEMEYEEAKKAFGYCVDDNFVFFCMHPQEAIDRLKANEEQKAEDAEIHLGDEVEAWDTNDWVRFIAWTNECGEVTGIDEFGGHYIYPTSNCRKTGKHFSISFEKKEEKNDARLHHA